MQGPQALARTTPPISSKVLRKPSFSMVKRTCSEPGVMVNSAFVLSFLVVACRAREAERLISSYEELVHDPIRATSRRSGQLLALTASANLLMGQARSGVKGPLTWGSN